MGRRILKELKVRIKHLSQEEIYDILNYCEKQYNEMDLFWTHWNLAEAKINTYALGGCNGQKIL